MNSDAGKTTMAGYLMGDNIAVVKAESNARLQALVSSLETPEEEKRAEALKAACVASNNLLLDLSAVSCALNAFIGGGGSMSCEDGAIYAGHIADHLTYLKSEFTPQEINAVMNATGQLYGGVHNGVDATLDGRIPKLTQFEKAFRQRRAQLCEYLGYVATNSPATPHKIADAVLQKTSELVDSLRHSTLSCQQAWGSLVKDSPLLEAYPTFEAVLVKQRVSLIDAPPADIEWKNEMQWKTTQAASGRKKFQKTIVDSVLAEDGHLVPEERLPLPYVNKTPVRNGNWFSNWVGARRQAAVLAS